MPPDMSSRRGFRSARKNCGRRRSRVRPAADSPNDTNSIEQPQKIVLRMETVRQLSADFTREFSHSITVLKLKIE